MLKTRTKKITAFMSVVAMLFSMLLYFPSGIFSIDFGLKASAATITLSQPSGDGTSDSPYQIGTAAELYWFADRVNNENSTYGSANAVLTANIVVNKNVLNENGELNSGDFTSWTPIGWYDYVTDVFYSYAGTFDGQNHTISGLYFNDTNIYCVSLFGFNRGTVKNVGVNDSYFNGKEYVGGVCGANEGTITNCYNKGAVSGIGFVGGVCGYNYKGEITNCYSTGEVSGSNNVGGVCGHNFFEITNCYYDSTVYSGDAVGYNHGTTVTNVNGKTTAQYNSGEVAYLLSQGCTIGETTYDGSVWGQTIGTEDYPVLGGANVYTASNCTGYSNTENETEYHNYINGICQWCGDVENDIMIYGHSITLDGMIGMNVYVAADEDYTNWTASFNGEEVEKPEKDENGLYKFTYQVAAKDMAEKIIFYINENVNATVSVKGYLDTLDTSESTKLAELVKSMEKYGTAASEFFKTDGTVPAPAEEVTADDLSGYVFEKGSAPDGISYYGSSLILESETTVRHYFKLDAGKNIDEFTFTIDGNKVIPGEKSGYYYIDVKNISAENLGVGHTVKIGDTEVISGYSALSYAKAVLNSTAADDNLKNLVKTIYHYNQAAVGYNMKTGWVQDGGNWYYFDDDGIMQTGWVTGIPGFEGKWFYFADNGIMQTNCFVQDGENWYYLNDDGTMRTGWLQYEGNWYYFGDDGIMQTSRWVQDEENWYYLNDDGTMLRDAYTPDGYYVDENGIWTGI